MRKRSGRPPKFPEPSQPVTLTLPLRTLRKLQAIDADRAKAIVRAVDEAEEDGTSRKISLIEMAPRKGLLVVPAIRRLKDLPWLTLIQLAPSRFLIAIESGTPIEKVEVALNDLIEKTNGEAPQEAALMESLREKLASLRRDAKLSKAELLLIDVG